MITITILLMSFVFLFTCEKKDRKKILIGILLIVLFSVLYSLDKNPITTRTTRMYFVKQQDE